jgi:hypothetical protein
MLLKIPGKIWYGNFPPHVILIQKQRRQKDGSARSPKFLADIWINGFKGRASFLNVRQQLAQSPMAARGGILFGCLAGSDPEELDFLY